MSIRALWISDHVIVPIVRHSHDYYQLIYCQSGQGEIVIGGEAYTAKAGYAYLVRPKEPHSLTPAPEGGMHAVELKFTVTSEDYDKSLCRLPTVFAIDSRPGLLHSFRRIVREGLSGALYSHESTGAAINLFLVSLLREHQVEAEDRRLQSYYFDGAQSARPSAERRETELLRVIDHIERHLSEEITLDELCELAGLEKSYLITRFKRTYGLSPMRYVHVLRIEQAKLLLTATDKSITEIAYEVGFGSIHYFSRFFKRAEGLTPLAYREKNRQREGGKA